MVGHGHPGPLAISVRQPWAWAILHAGKCIENRVWNTKYRGELYIHASAQLWQREYLETRNWILERGLVQPSDFPKHEDFVFGAVIGKTRILDVRESPRKIGARTKPAHSKRLLSWEEPGGYSMVIAPAQPTIVVPCHGAQRLWSLPDSVLQALSA